MGISDKDRQELEALLSSTIRAIHDYPKPGIIFRDVTTIMIDSAVFARVIDAMCALYRNDNIDKIAGVEARGFVFGAAMAKELGVGFVPVRKQGKLPWNTLGQDYQLEYGTDRIEIHTDMVQPGERILVVDDLIATGGTLIAALELIRLAKAHAVGVCAVVDLPDLGGSARLSDLSIDVDTLIAFEGH